MLKHRKRLETNYHIPDQVHMFYFMTAEYSSIKWTITRELFYKNKFVNKEKQRGIYTKHIR